MSDSIKEASVCVIGGGVAGAMLAHQLSQGGVDVLVLEAGPRHDRADRLRYMKKNLYGMNPYSPGRLMGNSRLPRGENWKRVIGVGGSGLHWAANVNRLHESDFELDSRYGMGIDWPIRYNDLEPFYSQAERMMGVAGEDAHPWTPWRSEAYPMPPFPFSYSDRLLQSAFERLEIPLHHNPVARNAVPYDGRPACRSFSMCQTCPILAKWTPDLLLEKSEQSGKVTILPETRVTRINCNPAGDAVESVSAASLENGRVHHGIYRARLFVLAAHAFESTRLLLLSRSDSHPEGLGNRNGCVGKYFAGHLSVTMVGELREKTYLERIGFPTAQSQYFYESSRQAGGTSMLVYLRNRGVQTPFDIAHQEFKNDLVWGDELGNRVRERFGKSVAIQALIEQLPHEENRMLLGAQAKDDLGLPVPKLEYSHRGDRERETMNEATARLKGILGAAGALNIRKVGSDVVTSHHMGTCRMGSDPNLSVVDPDLRVHDLDNLFVAGSSVFPTFGAVGPTLTIAALALRLGGHLQAQL